MTPFVLVYITCGNADEAKRIASILVEERLAACANRIEGVQSIYRWQGRVETATETLLLLKTSKQLAPALRRRAQALHGYACPCIVELPIEDGAPSFLEWLKGELPAECPEATENTSRPPRGASPQPKTQE